MDADPSTLFATCDEAREYSSVYLEPMAFGNDDVALGSEFLCEDMVCEVRPRPLPLLFQVLGTEDTFSRRYRVTSARKDVLVWRDWSVLNILHFCNEDDLKKLAVACRLLKNAVYSTLETLAQYKILHLEKTNTMNFINDFAAFGQLQRHITKFGKQSLKADAYTLLPDDELLLLYSALQARASTESRAGLSKLAESKWSTDGFVHFKEYVRMCVLGTMDRQQQFLLCFGAWKAILDVFALNFQLIKVRAWSPRILRDFTVKNVRNRSKSGSASTRRAAVSDGVVWCAGLCQGMAGHSVQDVLAGLCVLVRASLSAGGRRRRCALSRNARHDADHRRCSRESKRGPSASACAREEGPPQSLLRPASEVSQ